MRVSLGLSSLSGESRFRSGFGDVCIVIGPPSTTPESEAVVVAAEVVVYPSDMKDTGLGSLMVCESEMGESDLDPESCRSSSIIHVDGMMDFISLGSFNRPRVHAPDS